MNTASRFSIFALGVLLCGCTAPTPEGDVQRSACGERELRLTIVVPRATQAPTRAITGTEENTIRSVDILAFGIDGTNETFAYSTVGTLSPGNTAGSTTQTFTANLRVVDHPQRLVVITNAHTRVGALLATGDWTGADKATMLAGLNYETAGDRWNAASPSDYTAIPMWGESTPETITTESKTLSSAIGLMRMVARIDVQNSAERFKLKSAALYNTNTGGRIVPDADKVVEELRNGIRYLRVDGTTIPSALQRRLDPIVYTDFTTPGTIDTSMIGAIYTFESAAGTMHDQATCLVVGGTWDTDTSPTFYRVDFRAAGTGQRLDLLRNHLYVVNITKADSRGHATPDEAFHSTAVNMTADILVWDQPGLDNIVIGENAMATDKSQLTLFGSAYTWSTADNTFAVFTDAPGGWSVERTVDAADGTTPVTWLGLSPTSGAGGTRTGVFVNATENLSGGTRSAIIYLAAGRLRMPIGVTQSNEQPLALNIVDNRGLPVTELIFNGGANVTPASRPFTVSWLPAANPVNVSVSQAAQYAFPDPNGNGAPIDGTIASPSGAQTYIVSPPALTEAELAADPFLRKSSRYDFAISNNSSTATRSLILTQLNYTMIAYTAPHYQITDTDNQFSVRSNARWRIGSVVEHPARAGASPMLSNMITGTAGGPNTSSAGDIIRFTTPTTPGYNWGTVDVTFSAADAAAPMGDMTARLLISARPMSVYGINVGDGRYSIWQTSAISENLNTMYMLGNIANYGPTSISKVITPLLQVNGTRFDQNPINTAAIDNAQNYDVIFFTGAAWGDDVSAAINTKLLQAGKTVAVFCEDWQTLRSLLSAVFGTSTGSQITFATSPLANGEGATYQFNNIDDPLIDGIFGDLRGRHWGNDGDTGTALWNLPADQTVILSNAVNHSGTTGDATMQNAATAFRLRNVNLVVFVDGGFAGTSNQSQDLANTQHWPSTFNTQTWVPISKTYGGSDPRQQAYNSTMIANIVAWAAAQNPQ